MYSFPQNRVSFGFQVRFRLKNYWLVAQSKLCAVFVQKLEAGSGKNDVGNTRCCLSQGFECYNLSMALNLTRLAQQGKHLLTHVLAMHRVCACCRDKTHSLSDNHIIKTKLHEIVRTDVSQDFCRESCHFLLSTTQSPR